MPRGRRPGGVDTRQEIIDAARILFTSLGYRKTSLRAVAREAGVDPALVHHYFRGKPDLFGQTFAPDDSGIPLSADDLADSIRDCPREGRGRCLVRAFVEHWDREGQAERFSSIQRAVLNLGSQSDLGPTRIVSGPIGDVLSDMGSDQPQLRALLVGSVLTGIGSLRYTLAAKEMLAMTPGQVAELYGPMVQRFLDEPLPGPDASPGPS